MSDKLQIIFNTSEITAGTRGASLGPEAIVVAARKKGSKLFGNYNSSKIKDFNYLLDQETSHKFAKRIDGLVKIYEDLDIQISTTLKNSKFPLVIAADHGSAGGTIAGIKTTFPTKKLGVVWIDAHGDLHSPYTTPSGNIHGMPLSTALAEDNLPCKSNEVPNETEDLWNQLKNIGGISPKINAKDLVFVGVRDTEEQEDALMERLQIKNYSVEEVTTLGEKNLVSSILNKLEACDHIYVSFDVDSMDPDLTSYGTGTPVKNGLTPEQAKNILLGLLESKKVVCLEIVEVNPCLDNQINKMAEITFDILEAIVDKLENN